MSYNTFTPIVTNGLVLYLDAANTKSYPGTGTSWLDLSKNNNTSTLTNGPIFSSSNGGNILFDGAGDYSITNSTFSITTNNRTFEVWVKINNSGLSGFYPILQQNSSFSNGLSANLNGLQFNSNLIINPVGDGTNFQAYTNGFDPTPYQGQWIHLVGVIQGSVSSIIYLNGNMVSTEVITINPEQTARYVMTGYQSGYNMNMGLAKVYNRTLSSSEILQNYNATKYRYIG
jgi:hypothetical protein